EPDATTRDVVLACSAAVQSCAIPPGASTPHRMAGASMGSGMRESGSVTRPSCQPSSLFQPLLIAGVSGSFAAPITVGSGDQRSSFWAALMAWFGCDGGVDHPWG